MALEKGQEIWCPEAWVAAGSASADVANKESCSYELAWVEECLADGGISIAPDRDRESRIIVQSGLFDLLRPNVEYVEGDVVANLSDLVLTDHANFLVEHGGTMRTAIASALLQRFCAGFPYTALLEHGLVAVNPRRLLPIHSRETAEQYTALDPDLPPHVCGLAALAFKELCDKGRSQSILISGSAGSGKTTAFAHMLSFLAIASSPEEALEERLQALHNLLRPFLSARLEAEGRNGHAVEAWSSTRAFVTAEMTYDDDQFINHSRVLVELLELSRVTHPRAGRNFDIFYEMLQSELGCAKWLSSIDELPNLPGLLESKGSISDREGLERTLSAMEAFCLPIEDIFRCLAGISLLSRVQAEEASITKCTQATAEVAAAALGVDNTRLVAALNTEGGNGNQAEILMQDLYHRTVIGIVTHANASLTIGDAGGQADGEKEGPTITILDSPPRSLHFTILEEARAGATSFDSLCWDWLASVLEELRLPMLCHAAQGAEGLAKRTAMQPPQHARRKELGEIRHAFEGEGGIMPVLVELLERSAAECPLFESNDHSAGPYRAIIDEWISAADDNPAIMVDVPCQGEQCNSYWLDQDFLLQARGQTLPPTLQEIMRESECRWISDLYQETSPTPIRGLRAAVATCSNLRSCLKPADNVPDHTTIFDAPWVIACVQASDACSSRHVDLASLKAQVAQLDIEEALLLSCPLEDGVIQLLAEESYFENELQEETIVPSALQEEEETIGPSALPEEHHRVDFQEEIKVSQDEETILPIEKSSVDADIDMLLEFIRKQQLQWRQVIEAACCSVDSETSGLAQALLAELGRAVDAQDVGRMDQILERCTANRTTWSALWAAAQGAAASLQASIASGQADTAPAASKQQGRVALHDDLPTPEEMQLEQELANSVHLLACLRQVLQKHRKAVLPKNMSKFTREEKIVRKFLKEANACERTAQ